MKIVPYLNFNGNCSQAIEFYEKVFDAKATKFLYKDIAKFDQSFKVDKDKENWVMHAMMKIADNIEIQFADCDENGKAVGTNICLQINHKTADEVKATYSALKDGARIICDAQPTFYSPMYAELVDKFNIHWSIIQEQTAN